jgi:microcystin-dependent protein
MPTTSSRAIRYPQGTDAPDVPTDLSEMANDLDAVANIYFGTIATRGAVVSGSSHAKGSAGSFFYATDTGQLFLSTGSAWADLSAGAASASVIIGSCMEYVGTGDPSDNHYLLEDGRSMNSVADPTLASLYAVMGTTYGGTGPSAFNLPDSRGRVSVAPDNMGTAMGAAGRLPNNPNGRGNVGGVERVTLTAAESGVNSNGRAAGSITLTAAGSFGGDVQGIDEGFPPAASSQLWPVYRRQAPPNWATTNSVLGTLSVPATGSVNIPLTSRAADNAHQNLQPYIVKNKIIRVR